MFKKKEIVSAFDIEGSLVKFAQVGIEDAKSVLYRLAAEKAQTDSVEDLAKAVRSLVAGSKIDRTHVVVSLPRHKVTVRSMRLPSTKPNEIEEMVGLQAMKQLPFPPDKIICGYKVLGRDQGGYSDILIALAHRDAVGKILNVFNRAAIDVERLTLSSEALSQWYIKRQKKEERRSPVCLVDIGSSLLGIEIVREGRLDFTRSIDFSSSDDMEKMIIEEIKKSLFTYKKGTPGSEVTKLILTGRRSLVNREAPALKASLGLPMVYIDALKLWPRKERIPLPGGTELNSEAFTTVLSLGFNYNEMETNLIPKEIQLKKISRIAKESLIISLVLTLSIVLGISGIVTKKFIDRKRYFASINERLEETRSDVERLTRLRDITEVIKEQLNIAGSSVDIVRELYDKLPSEIRLTIFDYTDGRSCLLRGSSEKLSDVFKFISILEESRYFENVKIRYATKRTIKTKEFTDFEISCDLSRIDDTI